MNHDCQSEIPCLIKFFKVFAGYLLNTNYFLHGIFLDDLPSSKATKPIDHSLVAEILQHLIKKNPHSMDLSHIYSTNLNTPSEVDERTMYLNRI